MLRLGVDGRELRPGVRTGIRRYLIEVVRAAVSAGWVCVLYGDAGTALEPAVPGVDVRILAGRWTQWWDQVSLPRALAEDRVSVFLSPYYKGPLRAPCPVVLTIHDLFFLGYPGRRRPIHDATLATLARLYARRARAIIADSEHSKRSIVAKLGIAPGRVTVIPVALGPEFRPAPPTVGVGRRYGLSQPYVLYVGNFKPHKNLPRLLRAYAALPESLRGGYELVLAGSDRDGRPGLEALVARLGLVERVRFAGLIEDADLPAIYSGAALVVLPSLEEGFGLPALEAMACGAPLVVSDRGALPEVVADAALVVDADAEPTLTAAMTRALSDARLAEDLRARGLRRAALFVPGRTACRVLDVLSAVAAAPR